MVSFRKDAHGVRIAYSVTRRVTDNVVGKHPSMSMLVFCLLGKIGGPQQTLPSPGTAMKMIVASNLYLAMTRAISKTAAVPDASSFAPGASHFASSNCHTSNRNGRSQHKLIY
jgi:hypothetical protein